MVYIQSLSNKDNNAVCRRLDQERTYEVVDQCNNPDNNDCWQKVKSVVLQRLKRLVFLGFLVLMIAIAYLMATRYCTQEIRVQYILSDDYKEKALKFHSQRNEISRQLNLMKQAYGQLSCERLNDLRASDQKVEIRISKNGGWCKNASSPLSDNHIWDLSFSTALSNFLKGKTVGSFGEGPGNYKTHIDSLGQVLQYAGYDGAPYSENVTNGLVKFLDLTAPQYGLPAYDWVVSVEVGEHIPIKYEDIYLDNLVRHAREGVVLSWANRDQDGLGHINPKHPFYVNIQMKLRGFCIDEAAGGSLREATRKNWLRNNIHVYKRLDPKSFHEEDA